MSSGDNRNSLRKVGGGLVNRSGTGKYRNHGRCLNGLVKMRCSREDCSLLSTVNVGWDGDVN